MKSLHVVASLHPQMGGLSEAVLQLTAFLNKRQTSAEVLTNEHKVLKDQSSLFDLVESKIFARKSYKLLANSRSGLSISSAFESTAPDVLHSHGLWTSINHRAFRAAKRRGLKTVIHIHGMLDDWSLSQKYLKKYLALCTYQKRALLEADVLVVSSKSELQSIRRLGIRSPVAIIPNGSQVSEIMRLQSSSRFKPKNIALYLGRLHPKKGLIDLLGAWEACQPHGWELIIVGEGESSFTSRLKQIVSLKGLENQITFEGGQYGDAKHGYYSSADLFILPSYGENFGIAVLEALAHGVPVLTTNRTPWDAILTKHCGWYIEPGLEALAGALKTATSISDQKRSEIRKSAQLLALQYDWAVIGPMYELMYQWILGETHCPGFIVIN